MFGHLMGSSRQHILVLEHEPVWLKALHRMLQGAGLAVTATSRSSEALKLLAERSFAVAMLGIDRDGFDWERFLKRAKGRAPACKLIVLSQRDPLTMVGRALELGADSYVVKGAEPEDILFAVRQSLTPGVYQAGARSARPGVRPATARPTLTPREEEILRLLSLGCSNAEIAMRLSIKEPTVKSHLGRLYRKIGVRTRTQAASWATVGRVV